MTVTLREVRADDLPIFFAQQADLVARWMAAFASPDPGDWQGFAAKWAKILDDTGVVKRTILVDGRVAGNVMCHGWFGEPEVCYWIDRELWGQGIATLALAALLNEVAIRPLHAACAQDNLASRRVLEKCGFVKCGERNGLSNVRQAMVAEHRFILDAPSAAHG